MSWLLNLIFWLAGWIHWQWDYRRGRLLVLLALVLALLSLSIFKRPLGRVAAGWKSARLIESAQEAAAEGDWVEAFRAARVATEQRESVDTLRLLVQAARKMRLPGALPFGERLFFHPDATSADRREVLALALDCALLSGATQLVEKLPSEAAEDPDLRYQLVRFNLAGGHLQKAVQLGESGIPENRRPEFDLLLARALAQHALPELRPLVLKRLARTVTSPDREVALGAMRVIGALPRNWFPPRLARVALRRFELDSELAPTDRLLLASLRLKLAPLSRELLISSVVADFRDNHLALLTGWLRTVGAPLQVIALTDPAGHPAGLSAGVFQNRIGALEELGRYEQLDAELENAPESFPAAELLALQGAVAHRLAKEGDAVIHWQEAFEAARRDPNQNWYPRLATIARGVGLADQQMEALARSIEQHPGSPFPAAMREPLSAWLLRRGDTRRLLDITDRFLQRDPDNHTLINNFHYLRALHDQVGEPSRSAVRQLVEAHPEIPAYRATLALVLFQSGDPAGALATLNTLGDEPEQCSESHRALYAAALSALDRREEAEALAAKIDWDQLVDAEAKLLRP